MTEQKIKTAELVKDTEINKLIPRLLPLEYCNLNRAAKMLNIEVDDIKHFNEISRIKLYVRSEDVVEGEKWDEQYQDHIPSHYYTYNFTPFFVNDDYQPKNDDIYIMYAELKGIHSAIYEGKKLPDKDTNIRKARTESGQVDLIFALIQSIKELKGCFDKDKVKDADDLIREYLISTGVNEQITFNERTIAGWRESSKLFYLSETKKIKNKNVI